MGIEALTCKKDGTPVDVPRSREDWQQWVSAGRTRNWMLDNPLLDWLDLYGKEKGYQPDDNGPNNPTELDFLPFIIRQGRRFEEGILRLLQEQYEVTIIADDARDIRDLAKAEETFAAMQRGDPIVHQAVLWDAEHMTYGAPDFLIRSDVLRELFPNDISEDDARSLARDLGDAEWHYRVMDTKFTTLRLSPRDGRLTNEGSAPAYKAQLHVYNRMLGRLQGHLPSEAYILGRGWEIRRQVDRQEVVERGTSAFARLGPVAQDGSVANRVRAEDAVGEALAWVRRLRSEGRSWDLTDVPLRPELYPNMSEREGEIPVSSSRSEPNGDEDVIATEDWGPVIKNLADRLNELSLLPNVGPPGRRKGHDAGIYRWDDPALTPAAVGVTGGRQGPALQQFLKVNAAAGPRILPECVKTEREVWHPEPALEFYVDFEFCQDLNDDFSQLPEKGGQPLIFMIGCGHLENGHWKFENWITDRLTEDEELRIIRAWVDHMREVQARLDPGNSRPRIMHWNHVEATQLEGPRDSDRPNNSARYRHAGRADWPSDLNFYDFLSKVMRPADVAVKGAWGSGLKAVTNAMRQQGMIQTNWADSPVDGLGAMVGAWHCDDAAREKGTSMADEPLMKEIAQYNQVDCQAMMDIIRYLRAEH